MKNTALTTLFCVLLATSSLPLAEQDSPAEGDPVVQSGTRNSLIEWRYVGATESVHTGRVVFDGYGAGQMSMNAVCAEEFGSNARACTTRDILRSVLPSQFEPQWVVPEISAPVYDPTRQNWLAIDTASGRGIRDRSPFIALQNLSCGGYSVDIESLNGMALTQPGALLFTPCDNKLAIACCAPTAIPVSDGAAYVPLS